ncbi:MAG: PEP-CTERM sorting domain-containing protein [Akkermansiaceae bacterium]|nr:PEP-CTERM sorting domain-containing protein [Akkermansiaceae bacterium]
MAFDDDADGWSTGSNISVVIYDRDTQLSITPNYNFSIAQPGALAAGSYRSQILSTPITLSAGGRYSIVAWGFNANDQLYNSTVSGVGAPSTDDGGGLISFTGLARNSATTNAYPARPDTGPANRYGSASFAFQAVPEPTGVMLLSLGSLLMLRRRRNP